MDQPLTARKLAVAAGLNRNEVNYVVTNFFATHPQADLRRQNSTNALVQAILKYRNARNQLLALSRAK